MASDELFALIWMHQFNDEVEAHDSQLQARLAEELAAEYEKALVELSNEYGQPAVEGAEAAARVPMGGTLRASLWRGGYREFWLAACHEDRELPLMLVVGLI